MVHIVNSDDDFTIFLVNKKKIANDIAMATELLAFDTVTLVLDTTVLAKDTGVDIVIKTLKIRIS